MVVGCIHGNETAGIAVADRLAAGPRNTQDHGHSQSRESRLARTLILRLRPRLTNLVSSAARHHQSIRRRRPNRGPLRRAEPIAADAATALSGKRRDMGEPPTLGRHRVRR